MVKAFVLQHNAIEVIVYILVFAIKMFHHQYSAPTLKNGQSWQEFWEF